MTFDEFKTLYKNPAEAEKEAVERLRELIRAGEEAQRAYEHAIKEGNNAEILKASINQEQIKAKVEAQKVHIRQGSPVSYPAAEIRAAWNKHVGHRNAEFETKYAAYKKARAKLARQFCELVQMQRKTIRDYIAVYRMVAGEEEAAAFTHQLPPPVAGLDAPRLLKLPSSPDTILYRRQCAYPDAAFFVEAGDISQDTGKTATATALFRFGA